jgi:hypothetical protein
MIPPDLFFKFYKLFLTVAEGGKQNTTVKGALASGEKKVDLLEESFEHVGNYSQVP